VQYLCRLNAGADVKRPRSTFARFILGEETRQASDQISRPYGMAFWQGKLYVCDSGGHRGLVFDFAERDFRTFGEKGPFQVQMPINVGLGPDGEKYITDTVAGRVLVLDSQDQPVRALGARLGMKPCDVVWYEGELYVADLKTDTVRVLDPVQGVERRRIGGPGSAPGRFFQPTNLALGPEGHLFVCDTLNARVQVLDRNGSVVRIVGSRGRALGQLVRPKGIAVDRAGRLYVCDAAAETVLLYSREGRLLMALGGPGVDPGSLSLPAKVAISYDGVEHFAKYASPDFRVEYLVFVSNQLGPNKICVYGFGVYTGSASVDEDARFAPGPRATGPMLGEGFS
jgi:DNA-binding beta-propeller fold protein YncE